MAERSQTHRMKTFDELVQQSGDAETILRASTDVQVGQNVVENRGVVVRVNFTGGGYDRAVLDPYNLGSMFEAANRLGRTEPRFRVIAQQIDTARDKLRTDLGVHTI